MSTDSTQAVQPFMRALKAAAKGEKRGQWPLRLAQAVASYSQIATLFAQTLAIDGRVEIAKTSVRAEAASLLPRLARMTALPKHLRESEQKQWVVLMSQLKEVAIAVDAYRRGKGSTSTEELHRQAIGVLRVGSALAESFRGSRRVDLTKVSAKESIDMTQFVAFYLSVRVLCVQLARSVGFITAERRSELESAALHQLASQDALAVPLLQQLGPNANLVRFSATIMQARKYAEAMQAVSGGITFDDVKKMFGWSSPPQRPEKDFGPTEKLSPAENPLQPWRSKVSMEAPPSSRRLTEAAARRDRLAANPELFRTERQPEFRWKENLGDVTLSAPQNPLQPWRNDTSLSERAPTYRKKTFAERRSDVLDGAASAIDTVERYANSQFSVQPDGTMIRNDYDFSPQNAGARFVEGRSVGTLSTPYADNLDTSFRMNYDGSQPLKVSTAGLTPAEAERFEAAMERRRGRLISPKQAEMAARLDRDPTRWETLYANALYVFKKWLPEKWAALMSKMKSWIDWCMNNRVGDAIRHYVAQFAAVVGWEDMHWAMKAAIVAVLVLVIIAVLWIIMQLVQWFIGKVKAIFGRVTSTAGRKAVQKTLSGRGLSRATIAELKRAGFDIQ